MTQSDVEKDVHRSGTYGEAFRQFDDGNHYAIVSETYLGYLRERGLTVRAPVNLIGNVAEGVHLLLRRSDETAALEIIKLMGY